MIVARNSLGVTPCRLSAHKRWAARLLEKKGKMSCQLVIRGQEQYTVVGSCTPEREGYCSSLKGRRDFNIGEVVMEEKVHCCDWRKETEEMGICSSMVGRDKRLGGKGWQTGVVCSGIGDGRHLKGEGWGGIRRRRPSSCAPFCLKGGQPLQEVGCGGRNLIAVLGRSFVFSL